MSLFPQRIVCLTEESVEIIFALKEQHRIVGVSTFVERPKEAKKIPVVSSFVKANIEKIRELKPDLIIGYSDVQKDIARQLISEGFNVFIANHRSLQGIKDYTAMLGRILDRNDEASKLIDCYDIKMAQAKAFASTHPPLKIYLEEWDEPLISASLWWSEIFEILGVHNIFKENAASSKSLARQIEWSEVIKNDPDLMAFCWCGKKTDFDSVAKRTDIEKTKAWKNKRLIELDPTIFLQPGPAIILEGIDRAKREIEKLISSG